MKTIEPVERHKIFWAIVIVMILVFTAIILYQSKENRASGQGSAPEQLGAQ